MNEFEWLAQCTSLSGDSILTVRSDSDSEPPVDDCSLRPSGPPPGARPARATGLMSQTRGSLPVASFVRFTTLTVTLKLQSAGGGSF